jgi:putative transposase
VIDKLNELAEQFPTRGFCNYFGRIRNQGLEWNHKRVRRVYRLLGLNIRRKRKRRLPERVIEALQQGSQVNQTWSMDFMSDALMSGRKIRLLNIMDDFNREMLAIEVDTSHTGERVTRVLDEIIDSRGKPDQIRVDNGPEFTSGAFVDFCRQKGILIKYIQPGKPVQNGYIERMNRTIREDILDAYLFESLDQVRILTQNWMEDYNQNHPHQGLGMLSPVAYAVNSGKLEGSFPQFTAGYNSSSKYDN